MVWWWNTHGNAFKTISWSSFDNCLNPGNISADASQPSSVRNRAKQSTWCEIAWPPNFIPISVSCATFLMRISSFGIFWKHPAHPDRPDFAYSMPKSLINANAALLLPPSAARFLPLPLGFASGTTQTAVPNQKLKSKEFERQTTELACMHKKIYQYSPWWISGLRLASLHSRQSVIPTRDAVSWRNIRRGTNSVVCRRETQTKRNKLKSIISYCGVHVR